MGSDGWGAEGATGSDGGADAVVVVGGAHERRRAEDAAARAARVVVDVPVRPGPAPPWAGLAAIVDAAVAASPRVRVPLALDAVRAAVPVGDHLGLGEDLCRLLVDLGESAPVTLLVRDAHLMDLSSAAALGHALGDSPAGVRAVITQAPGDRGVHGPPVRHVGGVGEHPPVPAPDVEPMQMAAAGGFLDAAWWADTAGDLGAAAGWWLEGGRPDRCRAVLDRLPPGAHPETEARLAYATASARCWRRAILDAVAALEPAEPAAAARLLLLDASAAVNRGDSASATAALHRADRALGRVEDRRAGGALRDLHRLAAASSAAGDGADAGELLAAVERPLARLGAAPDPDAVRLLAAVAMPLGWAGHLNEARAVLDRLVGVLHSRRRYLLLPYPLATSAWLARRRSRVEVAIADGGRAIDLGRLAGVANDVRFAIAEVAHVEALNGRLEACRAHVAELVPPGTAPRGAAQVGALSALAVGELLADRPATAIELLEPVQQRFASTVPPAQTAWRHNLVQAYVRMGRRDDAEAVLADLERWGQRGAPPREEGQIAWCRALLAPAGEADALFVRASALLAPYPALRWRCELDRLRRLLDDGRRDEAASLAARLAAEAPAAGVAAGVEAVRRLQQAHGLLAAAGAASTGALSVQELRVALALAEGADDDEIADRFHRTTGDVVAARARVLRVLGVRAPEHLRRLLSDDGPRGSAPAEIRVLGPAVVARGPHHAVPPAGRPATLLALAALEGTVPVDRVLEVLWPDEDPLRSRQRLRNVLSRLRSAVGPVVQRAGEALVLASDVVVDAQRFDDLVESALRAPSADVPRRAGEALALWAGPPLPEWPYEDWAAVHRERLLGRLIAVLVRRSEVHEGAGEVTAALDDLEQALAARPDQPALWARALALAETDGRVGHARHLRRWAAAHGVELD